MSRSRIFEYIGATGPDGLTQLPGPYSFTSALIWALSHLSSREGGFTTSQLLQMILQAPKLPKGQMPVLLERGVGSVKRLILAPLKALPPSGTPGDANLALSEAHMNTSTEADEESSEQWRVDLRLLWQDLPTIDVIKRMADELSKLMTSDDIAVQRIEWKGLSLVRSNGLSTPEVKRPPMLGVAQLMALRWQNRVLKKKIHSLSLLSKLSRAPSSIDGEQSVAESMPMIVVTNENAIGTEPFSGPESQRYQQMWPFKTWNTPDFTQMWPKSLRIKSGSTVHTILSALGMGVILTLGVGAISGLCLWLEIKPLWALVLITSVLGFSFGYHIMAFWVSLDFA